MRKVPTATAPVIFLFFLGREKVRVSTAREQQHLPVAPLATVTAGQQGATLQGGTARHSGYRLSGPQPVVMHEKLQGLICCDSTFNGQARAAWAAPLGLGCTASASTLCRLPLASLALPLKWEQQGSSVHLCYLRFQQRCIRRWVFFHRRRRCFSGMWNTNLCVHLEEAALCTVAHISYLCLVIC